MLGQVGGDSIPHDFPVMEVQLDALGLGLHATAPSRGRCVLPLSAAGNIPQELTESLHQRIPQHEFD